MARSRLVATLFVLVGLAWLVLAVSEPPSRALRLALAVVFVLIGVRILRRRQPPPTMPGA